MSASGKHFFGALAALAAGLALLPLAVSNPYYLNVLNVVALNVLVVTGLNLLIGYAGQISLGHAAFFGLGAYISGILSGSYGWEPWLSLLAAALLVALVALVLGLPTLRLEGNYLVMATLGFNLIVSVFMVQLDDITGGPSGYTGIPSLSLFGQPIATDLSFYWLAWGAVILGLILARNLVHSRVGRGSRPCTNRPWPPQPRECPSRPTRSRCSSSARCTPRWRAASTPITTASSPRPPSTSSSRWSW